MAEFNGQFITNKGRNLLNRALAGEGKIIFTGAALGVGKHTDNLKEITDLKDKKLDMNVLSVRNDNGSAVLKLFITNEKVKESFTTQEFGVYAKIEGDSTPILYSYATAIEPDTIPSNKFGTTYEAINEIYMSFVSDIDTDIQVTHGNIFMTLEVASEIFLKHGYVLGGKLKEQTQLLKDRVYSTDANEHYLNIETRSWGQVERVDNKLIKLTYKDLLNFSTSNTAQQLATLNEKVGNAIELAKEKEPKFSKNSAFNKNFGTTPGTVMPGDKYPVIEKTFAGIAGNTINPGFIQDSGQKEQGKFYLDRNTGRLYRCIKSTQSTTNTADNFQDVSLLNLSDRLDNLFKIQNTGSFLPYNGTISAGQEIELDPLFSLEGIIILNIPYYYTGASGDDKIILKVNNNTISKLPCCEVFRKHCYSPTVIFRKKRGDRVKIINEIGLMEMEQLVATYSVF
ncbi:hypothetical protein [Fusobacterium sp. DD45]|uniref:hypothetical protein n=1 Tax=Fusobacterium sp. DD45 TaxID=2789600 RepID=UPI001B8C2C96|nr:hypothetical protein [Fusobacterium sp. DD45]MBR8701470.1 hypothetical protein [Fusobacterium sp. DD45]